MTRRSLVGVVIAIGWIASVGIGGLAFATSARAPQATTIVGRYVDVRIEAFQPWGFLGIGTWSALEPRRIALRIDPLSSDDADRLDAVAAACARGEGDPLSCRAAGVEYTLHRSYGITPNLDDAYRVVLTNRTDVHLGIVLEIDGINTNGSAEVLGTSSDKKWILRPGQTVRISGWQVSADEALAFRFATPSQSHSPLDELRGAIRVHVYLPDPRSEEGVRGTGAAELIDQPTVKLPFVSATDSPVEGIALSYARGEVGLGFLCEETTGTGIRISHVVAGTIAELKGLREGDVVTYINAVPIDSCADFQSFLAAKAPGDRIVLKVHRAGRAFLLTVELEE